MAKLIQRQFDYKGRTVKAYYHPDILAAFEKMKHTIAPRIAAGKSTMSRIYLAIIVKDAETNEIIKDVSNDKT